MKLALPLAVAVAAATAGCEGESPAITRGVSPEEHAGFFPITEGTPHALGIQSQLGAPIDCAGCHTGTDSFEQSTCINCHSLDPLPAQTQQGTLVPACEPGVDVLTCIHRPGGPGFTLRDDACLGCHPGSILPPPLVGNDHSVEDFPIDAAAVDELGAPAPDLHADLPGPPPNLFTSRVQQLDTLLPDLVPPAAGVSCNACHVSNADPLRVKDVRCHACHALDGTLGDGTVDLLDAHYAVGTNPTAQTHQGALFRALDGRLDLLDPANPEDALSCKECHADVPMKANMRVEAHGTRALPLMDSGHRRAKCLDCHQERLASPREFAVDWSKNSCNCCHADGCTVAPGDPPVPITVEQDLRNICQGNGNTNNSGDGCPP